MKVKSKTMLVPVTALGFVLFQPSFAMSANPITQEPAEVMGEGRVSEQGCHAEKLHELINNAKADALLDAQMKCGSTANQSSEFFITHNCARSWDDLASGRPPVLIVTAEAQFSCSSD